MEERNMRWGELIGGLLFVGGGVALAVSLREKLEAIPYSQFLLFAAIAVLVFGVGLYSHYRWKLANTSRGLLIIGTLLTPLSFLIMADLTEEHAALWGWAVGGASLAVFGYLVWLAARILTPEGPGWTLLGVLGNSAVALLLARFVPADVSEGWLAAAAYLPVAVFGAAVVGYLLRLARPDELDAGRAAAVLALLGTTVFAMILADGRLVAQGVRMIGLAAMLDQLAGAVTLAAVPVMAVGLTLARGMPSKSELEGYRATGTTVALVGAVVMLAALAMAWPAPAALVAIGAFDAAALAWIAFRYRLPVAHAGAVFCTAIVCLVGYHAATSGLLQLPREELGRELLRLGTSAPSGNVLGVLFVAAAAVAEWLVRRGHRAHAQVYAGGCGALAVVGLSLVTWHGAQGGVDALRACILYGVYGLVSLGLALRWNRVGLSYLGLALAQASALWALWWHGDPLRPALLGFATAAVAVASVLGLVARAYPEDARHHLRRILIVPLERAAMTATAAMLPWLCLAWPAQTSQLAFELYWLAAIWLVAAVRGRLADLFALAQATLTLATVAAATAWLQRQEWPWFDPRTAQTYGLALAVLGLAWIAARIGFPRGLTARRLFNPPWPAVDRFVHGAVVVGQLAVIVGSLVPGLGHELWPAAAPAGEVAWIEQAVGPGAWWLAGALAVGALAAAWHRLGNVELAGLLLVALSVPCLVAGRFASDLAVASALRWALASCFAIVSALVWGRQRLAGLARAAGARVRLGPRDAPLARGILDAGAAAPVVAVTLLAAALQLSGTLPGGPAVGSFFDWLGARNSYLVPLVLVIVGLVGYALRETSAPYAFAAGLVVEMTVVLGYLLGVNTVGFEEILSAGQWATLAAAVWAIAWMVARRWTAAWEIVGDRTHHHEGDSPLFAAQKSGQSPARMLMSAQLGLAVVGNAILILPALATLAVASPWYDEWAVAAAAAPGWAALVATVAALGMRGWLQGRRVAPDLVGLAGMTVLGLAACTVQRFHGSLVAAGWNPEGQWGFRVLMLGWALYSVIVAMAAWWVASLGASAASGSPPQALVRAAAVWVRVAGLLAVALGLKSAMFYEEQLWGATAIGLASVAGATMAVWRRREGWAFCAALGVNLAASLAVWHYRYDSPFVEWWLALVQANVIASASVAILWLLALRRLYELRTISIGASPLLALQTALPVAGMAVLCALPPGDLFWHAESISDWLAPLAAPQGWLALALSAAAAAWYWLRLSLRNLPHVAALVGFPAASLAACLFADAPDWQAYHALLVGFSVVGAAILAGSIAGGRWWRADVFGPGAVQGWTLLSCALVVVLTVVHGGADPHTPWWPGGVLLAQSAILGALAVWRRDAACMCFSGLALNVIATIAWRVWQPDRLETLLEANVLALGAASIAWSLVGLLWPGGAPTIQGPGRRYRFGQLTSQAALFLLTATVAVRVVYAILDIPHGPVEPISWAAWAALAGSIVVLLWDRSARLAVPGLYLACFVGVGLGLDARGLVGHAFCLAAMVDVAGFALAGAVFGLALPRLGSLLRALGIHNDRVHWPNWFSNSQTVAVALAAGLAAWVSIDVTFEGLAYGRFDLVAGRMLGPVAMLAVVAASLLSTTRGDPAIRIDWQAGSFVLFGVLLGCAGWARLPLDGPAPWLHRGAVLVAAAALAALPAAVLAARRIGARTGWNVAGGRAATALGGAAVAGLALVLGGEVFLAVDTGTLPMDLWAELVVAVGLAIGAAACILLAVTPRLDPLKLSPRGRTLYVYAAEALATVLCLHLWLAFPNLFALGLIRKYWMFLVMAVAFGGSWLGEWFARRKLPVLSEPLARTALVLPLVPAAVFWFPPADSLMGQTLLGPAFWFLMGLFYATLAVMRHSGWLAALAIGSGNMGLWILWDRWEMNFFDHPQLWLIPVSLCALVAEYLHHDRLTEGQSAGLRYTALAVIYVSSTTEFLRGVGESIWLPLVLVGLSVLGALAGILLRVQSFLYVGVTFLMVVLVRMILYAAFEQGQIWVFWLAVVALGTAIIGLFALFEKRRNDVLEGMRRLREWQK